MKVPNQMKLKSRVNFFSVVNWWIYVSYNTPDDCRGHTGIMMSLGKRAVLTSSLKHKLKMNILNEGN